LIFYYFHSWSSYLFLHSRRIFVFSCLCFFLYSFPPISFLVSSNTIFTCKTPTPPKRIYLQTALCKMVRTNLADKQSALAES
jgi:hypothetical protein